MLLLPTPLRKSVLYSARSAAPEKTERTSIYSFIYNNYFYPVAEYFLYTAIIVRYTPFAPLLTALPSQSLSPSLNVPFYCMGVVGRRLMEIVFHVMLLLWHFHMHFTKYTHTDTHIHIHTHTPIHKQISYHKICATNAKRNKDPGLMGLLRGSSALSPDIIKLNVKFLY